MAGRLRVLSLLFLVVFLVSQPFSVPSAAARNRRVEPPEIAIGPDDLPGEFTVESEQSRPMDPGPGVLYLIVLKRPPTPEALADGPVEVWQRISRFDEIVSQRGLFDGLRRRATEQDGYELVPGAANDGGTVSLQKLEGEMVTYSVGLLKNDTMIFTSLKGRRDVVTFDALLLLAGVTYARYDEVAALLAEASDEEDGEPSGRSGAATGVFAAPGAAARAGQAPSFYLPRDHEIGKEFKRHAEEDAGVDSATERPTFLRRGYYSITGNAPLATLRVTATVHPNPRWAQAGLGNTRKRFAEKHWTVTPYRVDGPAYEDEEAISGRLDVPADGQKSPLFFQHHVVRVGSIVLEVSGMTIDQKLGRQDWTNATLRPMVERARAYPTSFQRAGLPRDMFEMIQARAAASPPAEG